MKKLAILSSFVISVAAFAQGIKFEETQFKNLLEKAKKENKLIFLDAYTTWCGPCKLMAKNIFPQKEVGDYFNANFVNAKIDMEKGEGLDIAKKYGVRSYPTYLFINGDGEEVHRSLGYTPEAKDFITIAKDANDPSKRLSALKVRFEKGESDPEFLKNLAGLTMYSDADYTAKVLERYFAGNKELKTEDVGLLLGNIKSTESPLYKVFVDRKDQLLKLIPEKNYTALDKNIKLNGVMSKAYNKTTKTWDEAYFYAETGKFMTKEESTKILTKAKMNMAARAKDYKTYETLAMDVYKDYQSLSSEELNSIAWNFFENVNSKSGLETAVKWAQESVKKDENYANTDTLANLYNKVGDKKNAKLWAEKSVSLGKAAGEDTADTEKLLKSL